MNEKIKKIFGYISSFFLGILSSVMFVLLYNRRTVDRTGKFIKEAENTNRDTQREIDNAKCTSHELAESIGESRVELKELSDSVGRSNEIIKEIRKQKIDNND